MPAVTTGKTHLGSTLTVAAVLFVLLRLLAVTRYDWHTTLRHRIPQCCLPWWTSQSGWVPVPSQVLVTSMRRWPSPPSQADSSMAAPSGLLCSHAKLNNDSARS